MSEEPQFKAFKQIVRPLILPYDETKSYTIPPVTAENGLKFRMSLAEGGTPILDEDYFHMFLGSAYDEMVADGVDDTFVHRAAFTALADHQGGRDVAAIVWETGGNPKAVQELTKVPTVKKLPANKVSRRSKSTGEGTKTRSRASTSGTTPQSL